MCKFGETFFQNTFKNSYRNTSTFFSVAFYDDFCATKKRSLWNLYFWSYLDIHSYENRLE